MFFLPESVLYAAGVHLRNHSTAYLDKTTIEGCDVGLLVYDSIATLTDCSITDSVEKGAELKHGAKLTASNSSFSRTGPGPAMGVFSGVAAYDSRTNAVLKGCTFNGNEESAVTIIGGAVVAVNDSRAEGNKGFNSREPKGDKKKAAFSVVGSGRMTLTNTAVVGETDVCGGGKFELVGVTLNGRSV
jgi:hypothetical protein